MSFVKTLPPTTIPVIAGYKEPLTEVKNGFGYYGTIAYDQSETYTQCHICGYFYENLGSHVSAHKLTSRQYKQNFGLNLGTSLLAPNASFKKTMKFVAWDRLTKAQKEARIKRLKELNKNRKTANLGRTKKSLERKNLEGRCPDQLIQKIIDLHLLSEKTPSQREFSKMYGEGYLSSVYRTFGTWNNAVKIANLKPDGKPGMKPYYSKQQVVAMTRDYYEQYGRQPSYRDTRLDKLPSIYVYNRLFGSFSKAKEEIFK